MRALIAVSLCFITATAFAGPRKPHWGEWQSAGDCKDSSTHFLENGDTLSILYDDLALNMPERQTGDGLQARRQCQFRIDVHPPAGTYLAQIQQTYSGGIIKSKQSAAHVTVRYRVGQHRERVVDLDWRLGHAVSPESPASLFTETSDDTIPYEECRKKNRFVATMIVSGRRRDLQEFVVGGLDSADLRFVHRVTLRPVFRRCR